METTADEYHLDATYKGRRILLENKLCQFRLQQTLQQIGVEHSHNLRQIDLERNRIRRRQVAIAENRRHIESNRVLGGHSSTRLSAFALTEVTPPPPPIDRFVSGRRLNSSAPSSETPIGLRYRRVVSLEVGLDLRVPHSAKPRRPRSVVTIAPFDAAGADALRRLEGIEADDRFREKSAKDVRRCHDDARSRGSPKREISNCWQGGSSKQRCHATARDNCQHLARSSLSVR